MAQDLSMEYSFIFEDIEICIADRRDAWICRDLTIVMSKVSDCLSFHFILRSYR